MINFNSYLKNTRYKKISEAIHFDADPSQSEFDDVKFYVNNNVKDGIRQTRHFDYGVGIDDSECGPLRYWLEKIKDQHGNDVPVFSWPHDEKPTPITDDDPSIEDSDEEYVSYDINVVYDKRLIASYPKDVQTIKIVDLIQLLYNAEMDTPDDWVDNYGSDHSNDDGDYPNDPDDVQTMITFYGNGPVYPIYVDEFKTVFLCDKVGNAEITIRQAKARIIDAIQNYNALVSQNQLPGHENLNFEKLDEQHPLDYYNEFLPRLIQVITSEISYACKTNQDTTKNDITAMFTEALANFRNFICLSFLKTINDNVEKLKRQFGVADANAQNTSGRAKEIADELLTDKLKSVNDKLALVNFNVDGESAPTMQIKMPGSLDTIFQNQEAVDKLASLGILEPFEQTISAFKQKFQNSIIELTFNNKLKPHSLSI